MTENFMPLRKDWKKLCFCGFAAHYETPCMTCLFHDTMERLEKDPRHVALIASTECEYCGMSLEEYFDIKTQMIKDRKSLSDIDNARKCAKSKSQNPDSMCGHTFKERKPWRVKDGIV